MDEYPYDVAFSFLAQDEQLATQLTDALSGRLKVFLYSRQQESLAGTDGEKSFNDVFHKQTRVVVVLYRDAWGTTPWTRIEETAIRNRGYEFGYDFVLFVPLQDRPTVPPWLPKSRLWIGLPRWGVADAAAVIDARVQELGGTPRTESLEDRAARLERAANFKSFREGYARSHEGVRAADLGYDAIIARVASRVEELKTAAPALGISFKQQNRIAIVLGSGPSLRLQWFLKYTNSFEEAYVDASLWRGHPPLPGTFAFREDRRPFATLKIAPDVAETRLFAWSVPTRNGSRLLSPEETAEYLLSWWLEHAEKSR